MARWCPLPPQVMWKLKLRGKRQSALLQGQRFHRGHCRGSGLFRWMYYFGLVLERKKISYAKFYFPDPKMSFSEVSPPKQWTVADAMERQHGEDGAVRLVLPAAQAAAWRPWASLLPS